MRLNVPQSSEPVINKEPHTVGEAADHSVLNFERPAPGLLPYSYSFPRQCQKQSKRYDDLLQEDDYNHIEPQFTEEQMVQWMSQMNLHMCTVTHMYELTLL